LFQGDLSIDWQENVWKNKQKEMESGTTGCIGTYINRMVEKQLLSFGVQRVGKFAFSLV